MAAARLHHVLLLLSLAALTHAQLPLLHREILPRPSLPTARFPKSSPISSSTCGYSRVTHVGVSVNRGARATLRFKLRARAVSSEALAAADGAFLRSLRGPLRRRYQRYKRAYTGDLDIPFLALLGIDLDRPRERKHGLDKETYDRLADAAFAILKSVSEQLVTAEGTLKARGVSCMHTSAYAFVKVAELKLRDGKAVTVLSSKNDQLVAATQHGDTRLPSKGRIRCS